MKLKPITVKTIAASVALLILLFFGGRYILRATNAVKIENTEILEPVQSVGIDNSSFIAIIDNAFHQFADETEINHQPPIFTAENGGILKPIQLLAAGETSFAVMEDNTLWGWGRNAYGLLGDGTETNRHSPILIMDNVASVHVNSNDSPRTVTAITTNGELWEWGDWAKEPSKILENVASVHMHSHSTMAITTNGELWGWGWNIIADGQGGWQSPVLEPVMILENIRDVSFGLQHIAAITLDGEIWLWGNNQDVQIGNNWRPGIVEPSKRTLENIAYASLGVSHSMAVDDDGNLWAWGRNAHGQIGNGLWTSSEESGYFPIPSIVIGNIMHAESARNHITALSDDGILWAWGRNDNGQIGDGEGGQWLHSRVLEPFAVLENVASFAKSESHTLAVTHSGELWGWGLNDFGQIGNGSWQVGHGNGLSERAVLSPVMIMENIAHVYADTDQSAAITKDGELWVWGKFTGFWGVGIINSNVPVKILDSVSSFDSVSFGGNHILATTDDGKMWAWGLNDSGQIGDGTFLLERLEPVQIIINAEGGEIEREDINLINTMKAFHDFLTESIEIHGLIDNTKPWEYRGIVSSGLADFDGDGIPELFIAFSEYSTVDYFWLSMLILRYTGTTSMHGSRQLESIYEANLWDSRGYLLDYQTAVDINGNLYLVRLNQNRMDYETEFLRFQNDEWVEMLTIAVSHEFDEDIGEWGDFVVSDVLVNGDSIGNDTTGLKSLPFDMLNIIDTGEFVLRNWFQFMSSDRNNNVQNTLDAIEVIIEVMGEEEYQP